MKTLRYVVIALLVFLPCVSDAFEIDLPKHYRENLEKKRRTEAETIWRELDRAAIEVAIRTFTAAHPQVDGIALGTLGNLDWAKDGRSISCGRWQVFLAEWELSVPKLRKIRWDDARLVLSLAYDWKSKVVKTGGDGEVRLYFRVLRTGSFLTKRVIVPRFESSDYGEIYILLPFGGVELKRANQPPEPTAMSVTPRADARVAPAIAVAHL